MSGGFDVIWNRRRRHLVASRSAGAAACFASVLVGLVALPGGSNLAEGAAASETTSQSSSGASPVWVTWQAGGGNGELTNLISAVSCVSMDNCAAVGYSRYETFHFPTIDEWNGTSWGLASLPDDPQGVLNGVSCVSPSFCAAVGSFIAQRNGTTWTLSTADVPGTLNGVSCVSSTFCMSVGVNSNGSVAQTLIEQWDGTTWSVVPSPNRGSNTPNSLAGVSCRSSIDCEAVGTASNGGADQTLVEQWNGTTWSIVDSPNTSPTLSNDLLGVSCVSPMSCTAVGHSFNGSVDQTLIEQWNGAVWSITPSPNTTGTLANDLGAVSCPAVDVCYATGSSGGEEGQPLFLVWSGTRWTLQATPYAAVAGQGVSCISATFCAAVGSIAGNIDLLYTQGYWEVASDGGVFSFGSARFYGSMGGTELNAPIVGIAATPDGRGYWLVASDGGVFSFGDAGFWGSMGGTQLNAPIVGMAASADGRGYWLVASDGGVFSFGDAGFWGSMGGTQLNAPIVGMAANNFNGGYWLVAADGGVFSFGNAQFYGSMGGTQLNAPMVGMGAALDGGGYWLVAADGGVFTFRDAQFSGSMGGVRLNAPMVGIARTADGRGYWEVASDGGIFSFGSAQFEGSEGGHQLNASIVGMTNSGLLG
jgi:hypothetical protein